MTGAILGQFFRSWVGLDPRRIERLSLGNSVSKKKATIELISACTRLKRLEIKGYMGQDKDQLAVGDVKRIVMAWKQARGGTDPVLEELALPAMWASKGTVSMLALDHLPHLKMPSLRAETDTVPDANVRLPASIRKLHVHWHTYGHSGNTIEAAITTRRLLAACPYLTELHVTIGRPSIALDDALATAPRSPETLTLEGNRLTETSLRPLLGRRALRTLTLRSCHCEASETLEALQQVEGLSVTISWPYVPVAPRPDFQDGNY